MHDPISLDCLQQIEIIQFLSVFQDISLDLGTIHPGNEIFHASRN